MAIRSLILVSGGSVIGMLTFLGNLWTRNDMLARSVVQHLQTAILLLVTALVVSILTAGMSYVSALAQMYHLTNPESRFGRASVWIRGAAFALALLTTGLFSAGAMKAAMGLGSGLSP